MYVVRNLQIIALYLQHMVIGGEGQNRHRLVVALGTNGGRLGRLAAQGVAEIAVISFRPDQSVSE